jgi:hypothetical protein
MGQEATPMPRQPDTARSADEPTRDPDTATLTPEERDRVWAHLRQQIDSGNMRYVRDETKRRRRHGQTRPDPQPQPDPPTEAEWGSQAWKDDLLDYLKSEMEAGNLRYVSDEKKRRRRRAD